MKITLSPVDLKAYHKAIIEALGDSEVPVYLDTSFLMWLLQAGDEVRRELLAWLNSLGKRVIIPSWTVHELYKHIRSEKVLKEMQGRLKQYTSGLEQALRELAVTADDRICERTPFNNRAHLLQSLRADFVKVHEQLTTVLQKQKVQAQYERALDELIQFVNQQVAKTNPFSAFAEISATRDFRLSSKVPPGFKDEAKGENSCGDIVFWQEVLADLEPKSCTAAVIITNDNKSDWHYKPEALLNYSGERKPVVPSMGLEARLPHPLLEHEAFCKAQVEKIVIVDVNILGVVLNKMDSSTAKILVAATHPPLIEREAEGVNWSVIDPQSAPTAAPRTGPAGGPAGPAEAVPQEDVATQTPPVQEALLPIRDVGSTDADFGALLTLLEGEFAERAAAFDSIFAPEFLSQRARDDLLLLGRRVYRSAATQGAPADVRLVELLGAARSLPAASRNALALGMFVELYFDEEAQVRPVPLDGPWQPLFDLQYDEEFKDAVDQIAEMLAPVKGMLLAIPSTAPIPVAIELQLVKPPEKGAKIIESVIVRGKELLGDTVPTSESSLSTLLGNRPATVGALVRAVSRRFVIPLRQLEPNKEENQALSWADESGLRLLRLDREGVCDELSAAFQEEDV